MHQEFINTTIELALASIEQGGGPFSAIIVKDNNIIAKAHNRVTLNHDPTAHAEVLAIRGACEKIQHFDLSGYTLYASSEPCPMCLGAIYWARISQVYYLNPHQHAAAIGFDDSFIYDELAKAHSQKQLEIEQIHDSQSLERAKTIFQAWQQKNDKIPY